jgi:hypothetical protein
MKTATTGARVRGGPYEPSSRDIRRACEQIQASWTSRERRKRAGRAARGCWSPPRVDLSAIEDAIWEDQGELRLGPGGATDAW